MAFYKAVKMKTDGKWYPQAVQVDQPFSTDEVADRLAQISTVSRADVYAVLKELPGVMADMMAQGRSVRLDSLGTFRYTLDTEGVENVADFDAEKQIKAVRVSFIPQREGAVTKGGTQTRALVPGGIEWLEYAGTEETETDTEEPTDPSTPGSGDEDSIG